MDKAFLIQFAGSAAAVTVLTLIAAWAKLAKPMAPLSETNARLLLADEFPGKVLEGLWIADDGRGALARSGALALVLSAVGDGYVARHIPWSVAQSGVCREGMVRLDLADVAAPSARLAFATWPPSGSI